MTAQPALPGFGSAVYPHASLAGGVTVTPGVSNTPGAWVQMIASSTTVVDTDWVSLMVWNTVITNAANPCLLDIGVGAAGSEVVVVPSLYVGQLQSGAASLSWLIPVRIKAGSRVSVRMTSAHATGTNGIAWLTLVSGSDKRERVSPEKLVAMGADVANSTGVAVTADNTWTEIVAATPQAFRALVPTFSLNDFTTTGQEHVLDLGLGAPGSERVVTTFLATNTGSEFLTTKSTVLPVIEHVPAGSRITFRSPSATFNNLAVVVLGVPY